MKRTSFWLCIISLSLLFSVQSYAQSNPSSIQIMLATIDAPFGATLRQSDYFGATMPTTTQLPANGDWLYWYPAGTNNVYVVWNESGTILSNKFMTSGLTAIYSHGVPVQIFGGDSVGVNLIAGSGISITQSATADTINTTSAPPSGLAGGDLFGSYPSPNVGGVHLKDSLLTATAVLSGGPYIASAYREDASAASDTTTLPVAGSFTAGHKILFFTKVDTSAHTVTIQPNPSGIDSINGSTAGITLTKQHDELLLIGGSSGNWEKVSSTIGGLPPSVPPSGTAGGDLGGSYPNPSVVALQGKSIQSGTPSDGDVWVYRSGVGGWVYQSETVSWYSPGTVASQAANTTNYVSLTNNSRLVNATAAGDGMRTVMPRAGTMRNLYIVCKNAPGAGQVYNFTVMLNGVATALTLNISNAASTGNNTANSFTFNAGDEIGIRIASTATAAALPSWDGGVEAIAP